MIPTKKPKEPADPGPLHVCLEGHVSRFGLFKEGETARADEPAVRGEPRFWAPFLERTEAEFEALRRERGVPAVTRTQADKDADYQRRCELYRLTDGRTRIYRDDDPRPLDASRRGPWDAPDRWADPDAYRRHLDRILADPAELLAGLPAARERWRAERAAEALAAPTHDEAAAGLRAAEMARLMALPRPRRDD